eukprot:CAMPEP_0206472490 /NCGR_PEP_ID=MMETSP0324_2-20121206/32232_1 /ASSEMBLY_ACC=CAM_ASM_000836 /TAXON_ID=2866 /ORGANISM="Crypthecodinium cohnii, Strain Seligo" /LENGTH=94 /DNA_ID=CAMNT_0053947101 /DNA_START=419 /DNA_END=703 /DNA_ORIENTATION=-
MTSKDLQAVASDAGYPRPTQALSKREAHAHKEARGRHHQRSRHRLAAISSHLELKLLKADAELPSRELACNAEKCAVPSVLRVLSSCTHSRLRA